MDFNQFNTANYLKKEDVPEDGVILHIKSFDVVELEGDEGRKPALYFKEAQYKPLLLNTTNRRRLETIFKSSETEDMLTKPVVVYNDAMIEFGGKIVGGVRLRPLNRMEAQEYFDQGEGQPKAQGGPNDDVPF